MNLKKNKKSLVVFTVLTVMWILYYVQSYTFYSEVKEFITPGSSYMIKLLEFANYRGEELISLLIEYFVLFSINCVLYLYIYKRIEYTSRRKLISYVILINTVCISVICVISNIFWPIYLLLSVLSLLVLVASSYVSSVLFETKTTFQKGDIVFCSEGYATEKLASEALDSKLKKFDKKETDKVSGDIFNIDKEYFFEIYANDQLIFDSKGEFIIHAKD